MKHQKHPDHDEIRESIHDMRRKNTVYVSDETNEVWECHILRAIADLVRVYGITDDEARKRLREATIDNPTKGQSDVVYWTEQWSKSE